MSYLARLKQLDSNNNFTHTHETVLPKLPKAPSVSSVSSIPVRIEKIHAANDGENVSTANLDDAAEPIPDQPQRKPTTPETDEITALIRSIYANDTDNDRAEALVAALADPDGALLCYRTIAKDQGIAIAAPVVGTVKACQSCQYFARPGKADGYCSGRNDLPLAYGVNHPLRQLPADRGASCGQWLASE